MKQKKFSFSYAVAQDIRLLDEADVQLLSQARKATKKSYAPYSGFNVACAARLGNGKIVIGTNQENASYPVGICAERTLLATVGTLYDNVPIETLAVSYNAKSGKSNRPISPCGMCRQALTEYEHRTHHPMRILLSGQEGEVYIINTAQDLLPLAFGEEDLK